MNDRLGAGDGGPGRVRGLNRKSSARSSGKGASDEFDHHCINLEAFQVADAGMGADCRHFEGRTAVPT